jgi:hypothetical protein
MPGAVAQTSTFALNNATLSYTLELADLRWKKALLNDPGLLEGLNVHAVGLPTKPSQKPSAGLQAKRRRAAEKGYPVHSDMNCAASGRRFSLTCLIGVPR